MASRGSSNSSTNTSLGGGTNNLSGSVYDYSSTYGGKPNVPDPTTSAASAISGNLSNLGSLYGMADSINEFNTSEANKTQNELTPGYSANMSDWSQNIADLLAGKISSGTKYSIAQSAAERGISTGTSGSQNSDSALLRALGLTSESLQKEGASQLSSQIASSPKVNAFDLTPYLTTASDQQAAQYAANSIASTANPADAASAATAAAQSGLSTGLSSAGSAPSSSSGGIQSIASLLSSILGTGSGNSGSGSSGIASALSQILGTPTTSPVSSTPVDNSQDYSGDESNFSDYNYGSLYDNTSPVDYSAYA